MICPICNQKNTCRIDRKLVICRKADPGTAIPGYRFLHENVRGKGYVWEPGDAPVIEGAGYVATPPKGGERGTLEDFVKTMKNLEVENGFMTAKYAWALEDLADQLKKPAKFLQSVYNRTLSEEGNTMSETFAQVCQRAPKEIPWIIPDMLYRGSTVLLHAAGGCGKTLLIYNLIRSVSQSGTFLGTRVAEKVRCGLIQVDEPETPFVERIKELGLEDTDNVVKLDWSFGQIATLDRWIQDNKLGVVIIDSFFAAQKFADTKENDSDHAAILMRLRDIAQRTKTAIIIVHHSNKRNEARGSGAIVGAVSEVWRLCRPDPLYHSQYKLKSSERIFECEKTRMVTPFKLAIALNGDDLSWAQLGDLTKIDNGTINQPASIAEKVRAYIATRSDPFTVTDLLADRTMLGYERDALAKILFRAKKAGHIKSQSFAGGKKETIWFPSNFLEKPENAVMSEMRELEPIHSESLAPIALPITVSSLTHLSPNELEGETGNAMDVIGDVMGSAIGAKPIQGEGSSSRISLITSDPEKSKTEFDTRFDEGVKNEDRSRAPIGSYTGPLAGDRVRFVLGALTNAQLSTLRARGTEYPWGEIATVLSHRMHGSGYAINVALADGRSFAVTNLLAVEIIERAPKSQNWLEDINAAEF